MEVGIAGTKRMYWCVRARYVPQFIYIGELDDTNTTVHYGSDVFTDAQVGFLKGAFGDTDPVRLENQVDYLNGIGYEEITFRMYVGLGHTLTDDMIGDLLAFFDAHRE